MANNGFRIKKNITRADAALIAGFKGLPVANIGDSMNRMSCLNAGIRPVNSHALLGPAFTVKVRPGDNLMIHKALDLAQPGDVIVVDGAGDLSNALIGELMVLWAIRKNIAGIIIDGAIRDLATLRTLSIPVYAAGTNPAGPYKDGPGEINFPISCGGVTIHPGDIIVGDADGVVVIPAADAPEILARAQAKSTDEQQTMVEIAELSWDRAWVDKALDAKGCEYVD
jgi:RraA family protein